MNTFYRAASYTFALLLIFLIAGCNEPRALYDMAAFDRAYIPALVLTSKSDPSGESVMAIKELKQELSVLKSRNSDIVGWDEPFGKVEEMIMKADTNISAGDYRGAHKALEGIRHVMYNLRRDSGIQDYILDRMTEFHDVMEIIDRTARGKTPKTLTSEDITRIARELPKAKELWDRVASSPLNPQVFQFTEGKTEKLKTQFERERTVLLALEDALRIGDRKGIIKASTGLKQDYAKAFKLFGDFGAVSLGPSEG